MSLPRLQTQPVVVEAWSDGAVDAYGNPVRAKTSEREVDGYLEQTDAVEVQVDRDTFVSNWLLVLPVQDPISGGDRVRYGSATYEVIGLPSHPWNPRKRAEGQTEARLRLVTG